MFFLRHLLHVELYMQTVWIGNLCPVFFVH